MNETKKTVYDMCVESLWQAFNKIARLDGYKQKTPRCMSASGCFHRSRPSALRPVPQGENYALFLSLFLKYSIGPDATGSAFKGFCASGGSIWRTLKQQGVK